MASLARSLTRAVSLASVAAAFQPTTWSMLPRTAPLQQLGCRCVATSDAPAAAPRRLPTNDDSEELLRIRHTSAHVMAMAVQKLFKDAKVTIGPWISNGFYYDFDSPEPFLEKDLHKIKKEMDKIIQRKLPLRREEVSREEAERRIRAQNEPYKLEILEAIKTEPITIYHIGEEGKKGSPAWWDLCAGPHVEHTGCLPPDAISLESIAGAYWRGDETRPMLQRIYGTAWENAEQLAEHQRIQAEAKRRDHRVVGKALNLFSIQQEAGGGLVFWHPKGARIRRLLEDYWKQVCSRGAGAGVSRGQQGWQNQQGLQGQQGQHRAARAGWGNGGTGSGDIAGRSHRSGGSRGSKSTGLGQGLTSLVRPSGHPTPLTLH